MPAITIVARRGSVALGLTPDREPILWDEDTGHDIPLSYDHLAWLIHTAGPAALAAATTTTKE